MIFFFVYIYKWKEINEWYKIKIEYILIFCITSCSFDYHLFVILLFCYFILIICKIPLNKKKNDDDDEQFQSVFQKWIFILILVWTNRNALHYTYIYIN